MTLQKIPLILLIKTTLKAIKSLRPSNEFFFFFCSLIPLMRKNSFWHIHIDKVICFSKFYINIGIDEIV